MESAIELTWSRLRETVRSHAVGDVVVQKLVERLHTRRDRMTNPECESPRLHGVEEEAVQQELRETGVRLKKQGTGAGRGHGAGSKDIVRHVLGERVDGERTPHAEADEVVEEPAPQVDVDELELELRDVDLEHEVEDAGELGDVGEALEVAVLDLPLVVDGEGGEGKVHLGVPQRRDGAYLDAALPDHLPDEGAQLREAGNGRRRKSHGVAEGARRAAAPRRMRGGTRTRLREHGDGGVTRARRTVAVERGGRRGRITARWSTFIAGGRLPGWRSVGGFSKSRKQETGNASCPSCRRGRHVIKFTATTSTCFTS